MTHEGLLKYIASLSDEEKEKYGPLIEEALRQDGILEETFGRMKTEFENLQANLRHMLENASRLQADHSKLKEKLKEAMKPPDSPRRWN